MKNKTREISSHVLQLHRSVLRTSTPFRYSPVNKLLRGLNRATLTVHTILSIDNKVSLTLGIGLRVLIHTCGAESLLGAVELGNRDIYKTQNE